VTKGGELQKRFDQWAMLKNAAQCGSLNRIALNSPFPATRTIFGTVATVRFFTARIAFSHFPHKTRIRPIVTQRAKKCADSDS
jgi:hypothetical protein